MNRDEGLAIIIEAVADCLALDLDEVSADSRLVTDLGADSLDFIDLIFVLEKKFNVEIRGGELDFLSKLDVSNPDVMQDGVLTESAIDKLSTWLPALEQVPDRKAVTPAELFSLITVDTLWRVVEDKL